MAGIKTTLLIRLFWTYAFVLALGVVLLEFHNVVIWKNSFRELLRFNIPVVVFLSFCIVLILLAGTYFRLRIYSRFIRGDAAITKQEVHWRLLRFPKELFAAIIGITLFFSFLFHLIDDFWVDGHVFIPTERHFYQELMLSIISELLHGFTLAFMLLGFTRNSLRPYILELKTYSLEQHPKSSFVMTLLMTTACAFAITFFSIIKYILVSYLHGRPLDLETLIWLAGMYTLLSLIVLWLLAADYRQELQLMSEGIRRLSSNERTGMHGKMAIMSLDEMGRMTEAFNELQDRMSKEYEEVDKELQLAYNVQQQLMPQSRWDLSIAEISAVCIQHQEVGGDLFDIVTLDEDGFVVMAGDVSGKGISAALVMSAVLALFRAEVKYGGDPEDLLARINKQVTGTLKGNMYVTLGIALFDRNNGLTYASAGHVAPYLIRDGEVRNLPVSSLPLGIDECHEYRGQQVGLKKGDRLLFYSDGVVETIDPTGEMAGFERLEKLLSDLPAEWDLEKQLEELSSRLSTSGTRFQDDRTLVLLKWKENV